MRPGGIARPPRRSAAAAGLVLVAAATAVGCGGEEQRGPQRAPAAARGSQPPPTVVLADSRFEPATVTVGAGETVTWRNQGRLIHNVKGTAFGTRRALASGERYRHTFSRPGRYTYVCTFHAGMEGTIVVRRRG